jgi:hypothetical protein
MAAAGPLLERATRIELAFSAWEVAQAVQRWTPTDEKPQVATVLETKADSSGRRRMPDECRMMVDVNRPMMSAVVARGDRHPPAEWLELDEAPTGEQLRRLRFGRSRRLEESRGPWAA